MIDKTKRVLFICPTLSQPRFIKRVSAAIESGFDVTVLAYQRGFYRQNKFPEEAKVVALGKIEDGKYAKRSWAMVKALRIARKEIRRFRPHAIYAFGSDNLMLATLGRVRNTTLIYELGDLRTTEKLGTDLHRENKKTNRFRIWPVMRAVISKVEQRLVSAVDVLVLTSQGFASHINPVFKSSSSRVVILENKLPTNLLNPDQRIQTIGTEGPIRIGLIGLLRYRTIFPLLDVVERHPEKFSLNIWGAGPLQDEVEERISGVSNISFHGSFKYPEDIPGLYAKTDLNFVVYDNSSLNVRLALPNKYYESAFFGVPMMVAENTELWKLVSKTGTGFSVEPMDAQSIEQVTADLTRADLSKMQKEIFENISPDQLTDKTAEFFDALFQQVTVG